MGVAYADLEYALGVESHVDRNASRLPPFGHMMRPSHDWIMRLWIWLLSIHVVGARPHTGAQTHIRRHSRTRTHTHYIYSIYIYIFNDV